MAENEVSVDFLRHPVPDTGHEVRKSNLTPVSRG